MLSVFNLLHLFCNDFLCFFQCIGNLGCVLAACLRHIRATAAATAMGLAWKSGVAAEVLCLPRLGIGAQISRAKQTFETADLFAWTAVVILLSLLMERALTRLIRRPEGGKPL